MFLCLTKADAAAQTIWARAAAEEADKTREIMDYATARPAFEAWSKGFADATMGKSLGNIRAMHSPRHLAGKVTEILYDDTSKCVDVCIKVLDPVDWKKVEEGGYTGLSIGGGYAKKWPDPMMKGHIRYTPRIAEISLVDLPCIPSARFLELHKRDGTVEEVLLKGHGRTFAELVPPPTFAELNKSLIGQLFWPKNPSRQVIPPGQHLPPFQTNSFSVQTMGKAADPAAKAKIALTMHEWKAGKLRSWRGKTARGNPRKGPQVTNQKQAIAIALSQARRMGKSAAHPGFAAVQSHIAHEEGISPDAAGAILAAGRRHASAAAVRKNPRLKRIKKSDDIAAAIDERMTKTIGAEQNSHIKPVQPVISDPAGKRDGDTTVPGSTTLDWETTRKLNDTDGKKRRLDMPGYMTKSADVAAALRARQPAETPIAEALQIRMTPAAAFLDQLDLQKRSSLKEKLKAGASTGAGVGALVGGAATGPGGALVGSAAGGAAGAAGGLAAHGIQRAIERRQERRDLTEATARHAHLTDKEHTQRIGAAKARWLKEGHHDLDQEFDRQKAHAGKAILGRTNKLAAVEQSRGNAWHAVGDAQDAYDKVRKHLPADHHLMMEVPHAHGLLYNPEAIGEKHFDAQGRPDKPLTMLHPAEADDWIKQHGDKKPVEKAAPLGLVNDIRDLMAGPIGITSGVFRQLSAAA